MKWEGGVDWGGVRKGEEGLERWKGSYRSFVGELCLWGFERVCGVGRGGLK